MTNKILAAGSVALMGAGSLLGTATAANAFTDADCGEYDNATTELLFDDVCQTVFSTTGEYEFQAPPGSLDLEALVVGGGGGASAAMNYYAGGAGEVIYVDTLDEDQLHTIVVGAGGYFQWAPNVPVNGEPSVLNSTFSADGGFGSGDSANGFQLASEGLGSNGAGAGGDATATGPGPGVVPSDPNLVGVNNPLWPVLDSEAAYAVGGDSNGVDDTPETPGSGATFEWNGTVWNIKNGSDGAVVFRYRITEEITSEESDTRSLAATGVEANAISMTAGALGLGGVALAVVAAARRARRSK